MAHIPYKAKPAKIKGKLIGKRVIYYAPNGKVIVDSEVLTTSTNVRKNIRAVIALGKRLEKLALFDNKK